MLIPHSNVFVENMFSHISSIKTPIRNSISVKSVADIMKVKSYYLASSKVAEKEDQIDARNIVLFEPEKEHHDLYKIKIAERIDFFYKSNQ